MNKQTTAVLLNLVLSLLVFTLIWIVMKFVVHIESNIMLIVITAFLTRIICPTITSVETQRGAQIQLKSIFSKKVYLINKK